MPNDEGKPFKSELREYQDELRTVASGLRAGARRWRLPSIAVAVDDLVEHAGAPGVEPTATFEYALPHAAAAADVAATLDGIADELEHPIAAAVDDD